MNDFDRLSHEKKQEIFDTLKFHPERFNPDTLNKFQMVYDKFITMSDLFYKQSELPHNIGIQDGIIGRAEAYESAAEYLARTFRGEIKETLTKRFKEIRRDNIQEMSEHNEPMSDYKNSEE